MALCFVLPSFSGFVNGQNSGKGDAFSSLESRLQEMAARYQKILSPHTSPGAAAGTGSGSPIVAGTRSDDGGQGASSSQVRLLGEGDQGASLASQGVRKDSLEVSRGSYYLLPFVSLAIPSSVSLDVGKGSKSDLEAEIGYALGFAVGRRWKNWVGEFHLDYGKTEYVTLSDPSIARVLPAAGESEIIVVGARAGYGFPLGEDGWLRMGLGVGIGSRDDEVTNLTFPSSSPSPTDHSVFTYDVLLGLGYAFTEDFSGHLGYRFLGTTDNGDFGPLRNHLIELAFGADF